MITKGGYKGITSSNLSGKLPEGKEAVMSQKSNGNLRGDNERGSITRGASPDPCCSTSVTEEASKCGCIFFWLCWVPVVASRIFSCSIRTPSCGMWDTVPQPGLQPLPPLLGTYSPRDWATRKVPVCVSLMLIY